MIFKSRGAIPMAASGVLLAVFLYLSSGFLQAADEAATEPLGYVTIPVAGRRGSGAAYSMITPPLTQPVLHRGELTASGASTAVDQGDHSGWGVGRFSGVNGSHYVMLTSGPQAGWWADIVEDQGGVLVLSRVLPDLSGGAGYVLRAHLTLEKFFGSANEAGLKAGLNMGSADVIGVYDANTQSTANYFWSTIPGFLGWRNGSLQASGSQIIAPGQGIIITRRDAGDLELVVSGQVCSEGVSKTIKTGYNAIGNPFAGSGEAGMTLDNANLYTGDPLTGMAAGLNMGMADSLSLYRPNGVVELFFYSSIPGFPGWRNGSLQAAGNTPIAPGTGFIVRRQNGRPPFDWQPQPLY